MGYVTSLAVSTPKFLTAVVVADDTIFINSWNRRNIALLRLPDQHLVRNGEDGRIVGNVMTVCLEHKSKIIQKPLLGALVHHVVGSSNMKWGSPEGWLGQCQCFVFGLGQQISTFTTCIFKPLG